MIPRAFAFALVAPLTGCFATPSPLAPGLKGTVGVPHMGVLTESEELPPSGPGYRRFRPTGTAYHGVPRLVSAIRTIAAELHENDPTAPPLIVGDLSARTGGKVPRHNSHRSGRDVDFLFFLETPEGIPAENPGFFPIDADGFVRVPDGRYYRLDERRQWRFVRRLVTDTTIDVQFLFLSKKLEARLLDYALSIDDDWEILYRAQSVMQQPGDSLPHADHIHMRVACRPEEAVFGCLGGGPYWPWFEPLPSLPTVDASLFASLASDDPFPHPPLELDAIPGESDETAPTPPPPLPRTARDGAPAERDDLPTSAPRIEQEFEGG